MAERSDQHDDDPVDPNSYSPLPLGPPSQAQGGLKEELGELGFPGQKPTVSSSVPIGFGRFAIPHVATFTSISNLVSRTYLSTFDEALLDNPQNGLVMRRDPVIMEALWSRQVLCAQLEWHLEPEDHRDKRQVRMAQELERTVRFMPRLQDLRIGLLEDIWYGRYGMQFATKWDWTRGYKRLVVHDHFPINGDKIVFRFSGQPAILMHGAYRGPVIYTDRGRAHPLSPSEREQFIITRYTPEDADYLEGEMAGKRFGVGLRSKIYWWWFQRNNVAQWMFDFLQIIGAGGLTIYYYEEGNAQSYNQALAAASAQQTNQAVLMPRRKGVNAGVEEINKVERLEPSNAGAQLLYDIITKYYNDQIRSFIKGELLTTKVGPTGLGSNVAEQHAKTATRITKFDATRQQEYLTTDLVWPLQRHTYLDMPPERCPVRWVFDVEQPEPKEFLDAAKVFADLGGLLDAGQVRGVMGFRKPEPGSELLFNPTARQQIMETGISTTMTMADQQTMAGGPNGTGMDEGSPDTAQETGVNEPRTTQPDNPPVANDVYGPEQQNGLLPPDGVMSNKQGEGWPMLPNPNVDNPGRRVRRRKESVNGSEPGRVVNASEVLSLVRNSPQWKARDEEKGVDWLAYADKFGVHGHFVRGTSTPQHLGKLIDSGDLIPAKKLSADDIREKETGEAPERIHEVAITRKPGTDKMLIVDGNHSLRAAINIDMKSIRVVVDVDDSHRVLRPRKRIRRSAENSSWQHYFSPKGREGWKHTETGKVRYQKERPLEWEDKLMVEYHREVPYKTQSHEPAWVEEPRRYAAEDWHRETGERGSSRKWVNVQSGAVVYSDQNPGGQDRGQAEQQTQQQASQQTQSVQRLNRSQMQSLASQLAVSNLASVLRRIESLPEEMFSRDEKQGAVEFAKTVDKYYKKRDGFVPKSVSKYIDGLSGGAGGKAQLGPSSAAQQQPRQQASQPSAVSAADNIVEAVQGSQHNMISLAELGQRLGLAPTELHREVNELRRQGVLTGLAHEGRFGVTPEEQRYLLNEPGSHPIGFVSLRNNPKQVRHSKAGGHTESQNEPDWSGYKKPIANSKTGSEQKKQDRSVFGYIEMPKGADPDAFAQCGSCTQFTGKTCLNFALKDKVKAGGSCDIYVYGNPRPDLAGQETSSITPEEAGYVERPVRCVNCAWAKDSATHCGFYEYTNEAQPDRFSLDVSIKPTSCCNAQTATDEFGSEGSRD